MITRFITSVKTAFNPLSRSAKSARLFLALLPPKSQDLDIKASILPQSDVRPVLLELKFKDGKDMKFEADKLTIQDIVNEVDRHSRILRRKEELSGN